MLANALNRLIFGVFLLSSQLALSVQLSSDKLATIERYNVGGEGGWDLLTFDSKHHRLFISRSNHVQVIDADSEKVIGDIPDTEGVHGIAIADELNLGFTSNGKSNSVTVFNLSTLQVIEKIKTSGLNPDIILYEPKSKHIFTFNGRSFNATVIDAIALKEIATIDLSGKPELAVSNDAGNIFVNIEDKNEIAVIDSVTNNVLKYFSLGGGVEPTGLAIDKKHNRLFSVCANKKMMIINSKTGHIVSEVVIGSGPDSAAFDEDLGIALSSNKDGTLTLVKENTPDDFSVLSNLVTQIGARSMAYEPDTHRAFLVTASLAKTQPETDHQTKLKPIFIPNSFVVLRVSLKH